MTQRREEDELSVDKRYELEEKIDNVVSTLSEGPQEGPTTTQNEMPSGTADEEDLIKKQKTKTCITSQTSTTDVPCGRTSEAIKLQWRGNSRESQHS